MTNVYDAQEILMKARLHDIAQKTGLSIATVSRALHRADSRNVSPETREHVLSVARALGYQPNLLGRSLVTGRTHTVSYWTYNAFAPYYSRVARAICRQGATRGYFVHMHNTLDWGGEGEEAHRGMAMAMSFDGVIACDGSPRRSDPASRSPLPMVSIGIGHDADCDFVSVDLSYGTHLLMEHLFQLGVRRIVHLTQTSALRRKDPRAQEYDHLMREAGLSPEYITMEEDTREQARDAIRAYIPVKGVPEAIFCMNDEVAVGCYRGLADLDVEVPDDTLLVGCDGLPETEFQRCPITTIATPIEQMCELAWDFLETRIQNPRDREFQQITLKPELIVRESTTGKKHSRLPG